MTKQTISAHTRNYAGSAESVRRPVSEVPSTPAALGKEVAGMVQEALSRLPRDGVLPDLPVVTIYVSAERVGVDLTTVRTKVAYDMNRGDDSRPSSPSELLAFAEALKGSKSSIVPDKTGYVTLEVDVR